MTKSRSSKLDELINAARLLNHASRKLTKPPESGEEWQKRREALSKKFKDISDAQKKRSKDSYNRRVAELTFLSPEVTLTAARKMVEKLTEEQNWSSVLELFNALEGFEDGWDNKSIGETLFPRAERDFLRAKCYTKVGQTYGSHLYLIAYRTLKIICHADASDAWPKDDADKTAVRRALRAAHRDLEKSGHELLDLLQFKISTDTESHRNRREVLRLEPREDSLFAPFPVEGLKALNGVLAAVRALDVQQQPDVALKLLQSVDGATVGRVSSMHQTLTDSYLEWLAFLGHALLAKQDYYGCLNAIWFRCGSFKSIYWGINVQPRKTVLVRFVDLIERGLSGLQDEVEHLLARDDRDSKS